MNCAVHTDTTATAYCRTCGKPMCPACAHNVRGVVYCEDCIAHRIGAAAPAAAVPGPEPFAAHAVQTPSGQVVITGGPSPGLAGVLAFFFPFGVGQVYTGQYAKGLAHLLIFAGLIFGLASNASDSAKAVLGISLGFFVVYQIIDAVRSANAVRLGQAPPDPFGLSRTFTTGERVDVRQVPMGAVILIAVGVLFLLDTMDIFPLHWIGRLWPVILIVLGVWMFMKRMSPSVPRDGDTQGGQ